MQLLRFYSLVYVPGPPQCRVKHNGLKLYLKFILNGLFLLAMKLFRNNLSSVSMLLLGGNNKDLEELQLDLQVYIFLSINSTILHITFVFSLFNKIIIKFP